MYTYAFPAYDEGTVSQHGFTGFGTAPNETWMVWDARVRARLGVWGTLRSKLLAAGLNAEVSKIDNVRARLLDALKLIAGPVWSRELELDIERRVANADIAFQNAGAFLPAEAAAPGVVDSPSGPVVIPGAAPRTLFGLSPAVVIGGIGVLGLLGLLAFRRA